MPAVLSTNLAVILDRIGDGWIDLWCSYKLVSDISEQSSATSYYHRRVNHLVIYGRVGWYQDKCDPESLFFDDGHE